MKILCVCLGNICRSPTAEGILKTYLKDHREFYIDSAGTSGWHEGEAPDARSTYHASLRGYDLKGQSRGVRDEDFKKFDVILAMDQKNQFDLIKMCSKPQYESKIKLITDYCKIHEANKVKLGVPDPYYKGEEGFGLVLDILEDACSSFVEKALKGEIK